MRPFLPRSGMLGAEAPALPVDRGAGNADIAVLPDAGGRGSAAILPLRACALCPPAMLPTLALPRHLLDIRSILLEPEVEGYARG